jgi:hypothetical protein
MIKGKKGAEMTIGTIIIIILALVVLVVIIYGFTTGWSNLWDKLTNFGSQKENVQTIVDSCNIACSTGSTYDYCTKTRTINFKVGDDIYTNSLVTCRLLEGEVIGTLKGKTETKPLASTGLSCLGISCP